MDPFDTINNISTQSTQFINACESSISPKISKSNNTNEQEAIVLEKLSQLKNTVGESTNEIVKVVEACYSNSSNADSGKNRDDRQALVEHACTEINNMEKTFDNNFSRLKNFFHRIIRSITNKADQVQAAVKKFFQEAVTRIRGSFS